MGGFIKTVACTQCGKIIPRTQSMTVLYNHHRFIFCCQRCGEKWVKQQFWYDLIGNKIGIICRSMGKQRAKNAIDKWSRKVDLAKVDKYLEEHLYELIQACDDKELTAFHSRMAYLNACVENNIEQLKDATPNIDKLLTEFYTAKHVNLQRRKTLAEYEDEYNDGE